MATSLNYQVPQEVGYLVVEARVLETGRKGEIWVPACLTAEDGDLEDESQY